MKLAILVKYNGTRFEGFQAQPSGNTVQGYLTEAAAKVFGEECAVTGCSRTDSGVHALGYVASIAPVHPHDDWCKIPPEKFHRAVRRFLPDDISVIGGAYTDDSFHPRYSAKGKEYVYRFRDSVGLDPFEKDRVWQLPYETDENGIERMRICAEEFTGKHDFSAFMSAGSTVRDTVREVKYVSVSDKKDGIFTFTVCADGFLYNMVRIMAGTLYGAAAGRITADTVKAALKSGRRDLLDMTAPPSGLYLTKVFYDEKIDFKCI